jgi:alkaline phosphatase
MDVRRSFTGALLLLALAPPGPLRAQPIRNVILCVGDGMGIASITGARILHGERQGLAHTATAELFVDSMPYTALVRTYSLDGIVTDSAAAMTAMVCGEKVPDGWLAMAPGDGTAPLRLRTILEIAESQGLATGVVTTTRVTHATPAACYAHVRDREQESEIAQQLLPGDPHYNTELGDGVEVVLGGGRATFLPEKGADGRAYRDEEGVAGRRRDGRNLIEAFRRSGYLYVQNRSALLNLDPKTTPRLLGLFDASHMAYEDERSAERTGEPSLTEMVTVAVSILSQDPDGYFLMIEGGRIDHALHANQGIRALNETLAFDQAVRAAASLADPRETLLLVTADHDHTMTIAGYPPIAEGVTGMAGTSDEEDGRPYPTLVFGTGPGRKEWSRAPHPPAWYVDPRNPGPSAVLMDGDAHGAMDVPLYAWGAERHVKDVHGTLQNTTIYSLLREALQDR